VELWFPIDTIRQLERKLPSIGKMDAKEALAFLKRNQVLRYYRYI